MDYMEIPFRSNHCHKYGKVAEKCGFLFIRNISKFKQDKIQQEKATKADTKGDDSHDLVYSHWKKQNWR